MGQEPGGDGGPESHGDSDGRVKETGRGYRTVAMGEGAHTPEPTNCTRQEKASEREGGWPPNVAVVDGVVRAGGGSRTVARKGGRRALREVPEAAPARDVRWGLIRWIVTVERPCDRVRADGRVRHGSRNREVSNGCGGERS